VFLAYPLSARRLGAVLAFGVLLRGAPVLAQPSEVDRASARSLAAEGYDALERKDYATAADRFRHADALVHAPTISVDFARALVGLGRLVEAQERYQLVIREGVPKGSPASWKQALEDAQKEVADLEPRLSWIVIHVMGPLDPEVTIDGVKIPEGSIGARRAADPGKAEVRATAPGFEEASESVTLREGDEQTVTLVLKKSATQHPAEAEPPPAVPQVDQHGSSHLPAWIAFGVGGAGLVLGSVTGIWALGAHSDLDAAGPSGTCHPKDGTEEHEMRSDLSRYHTLGTISGVGFAIAIAGAATGAVLLVTGGAASAPAKAAVFPVVGPGSLGVAGRF